MNEKKMIKFAGKCLVVISIMLFIINIIQPLDRWVVGYLIFMVGYFGYQYTHNKN